MVKTENNQNERTHNAVPATACMDCLFWYRCRGARLDCLFRAPLGQANVVRA